MSQEVRHAELREKTQQLLQGALKHVRAAALAAALVPLGAVAVSPAVAACDPASGGCPSVPSPCDFVTSGNGQCDKGPSACEDLTVRSSITSSVPTPCDFVTSGGFVIFTDLTMANFGAHGGCKEGGFWGHVNYVDHGSGYHVDSIQITGYLTPFPGSKTRDICGWATTNADPQPVRFRVRLIDNGEPGTSDMFGIRLDNGYHVPPSLLGRDGPGGGNVQLHEPNPSTVAPNPPPNEVEMCAGVVEPY